MGMPEALQNAQPGPAAAVFRGLLGEVGIDHLPCSVVGLGVDVDDRLFDLRATADGW
jgi:hypothetical protein